MNEGFFEALAALECENSVEQQLLVDKVKEAMLKAAKKAYPHSAEEDFRVEIDPGTHQFAVWMMKTAVDGPLHNGYEAYEIPLAEARLLDPAVEDGDFVECQIDPAAFGRSIAQLAKQSIRGELRAINREQTIQKFKDKVTHLLSVKVTQVEPGRGSVTVVYDGTELYLSAKEQIPGETLTEGQMVKVYVSLIANPEKKPVVRISRVDRELVRRLFELAVPEVADGIVEIKSVAREAGFRSKIAVWSNDPNVDAVGACIGPHRSRIESVVGELNGEKIDIIPYSESSEEFIARALAPATVLSTTISDEENKAATVIVPNQQLSLAIGNKGQNAKLAAKLTGYKIDIKPEYPTPEKDVSKDEDASAKDAEIL